MRVYIKHNEQTRLKVKDVMFTHVWFAIVLSALALCLVWGAV